MPLTSAYMGFSSGVCVRQSPIQTRAGRKTHRRFGDEFRRRLDLADTSTGTAATTAAAGTAASASAGTPPEWARGAGAVRGSPLAVPDRRGAGDDELGDGEGDGSRSFLITERIQEDTASTRAPVSGPVCGQDGPWLT